MTRSAAFVLGVIAVCLTVLSLNNGIGSRNLFPSPEQDLAVVTSVRAEMDYEFGEAWSAYRNWVCKTNHALYATMSAAFREKLDARYGYRTP